MKTSTINTRIDPATKKAAEAVFAQLGLSTSDAITLFFRQVGAHKGLPFPLKIPNKTTLKAMRDAETNKNMEKVVSIEDLWKL